MDLVVIWICVLGSISLLISGVLIGAILKLVGRISDTNKQLLIALAGKETPNKVDTMRALVASQKEPAKNIPGIATKKKEEKSKNQDYQMRVG